MQQGKITFRGRNKKKEPRWDTGRRISKDRKDKTWTISLPLIPYHTVSTSQHHRKFVDVEP